MVYGFLSASDMSHNPLAVLYNASTGSVDLSLREVRVSVSPKGQTAENDVCYILGATATGTASGSAVAPTTLDPTYPSSVATPYGGVISGISIHDPMNGFLVQPQAQNLNVAPTPPILVADVNAKSLDRSKLTIAPGGSYIVTLTALSIPAGTTVFAYITEFTWDESVG